jgi:hypothetical protein
MAHWIKLSTRRPYWALACALGLALFGCSGGGAATGPNQGPPVQDPPGQDPPAQDPPTHNPPPAQDQGIVGTYTLAKINDSDPGKMVTLSNPDGNVIGLYRFDQASELTLDALGAFTLNLRYSDDKGEYGLPDEGEFKWVGGEPNVLSLSFSSTIYNDHFTAIAATNGVVSIQYDFDGDGQLDTVFGFIRVGG